MIREGREGSDMRSRYTKNVFFAVFAASQAPAWIETVTWGKTLGLGSNVPIQRRIDRYRTQRGDSEKELPRYHWAALRATAYHLTCFACYTYNTIG